MANATLRYQEFGVRSSGGRRRKKNSFYQSPITNHQSPITNQTGLL
ncbi:hypothetical protein PN471_13720 [Aphanizomenon sp. CS-733/32]|nr:hypothetical protein [Aphanizomenon sp. CS-733/32]MDB9309671.1 hypothetical protein [Aphanizomenon sp. CS-733/32]